MDFMTCLCCLNDFGLFFETNVLSQLTTLDCFQPFTSAIEPPEALHGVRGISACPRDRSL